MKTTIDKIDALHKAGKILSRIFFILSAVGLVALVISAIYLFVTGGGNEKIEKIFVKYGYSSSSAYLFILVAAISLIGELFLSFKAEKYFSLELERGTPFTREGAKSLFRLGLYSIIVSVLTNTASFLIFNFASIETAKVNYQFPGSIALGVMFIITSLILKYGCELKEENDD